MADRNDPRRHGFDIGDKVVILTKTGGCYDKKTGTVISKLDAGMNPDPGAAIPHFYEVRTDDPVDLGDGKLSCQDVHPSNEVFPAGTPVKNYWDTRHYDH